MEHKNLILKDGNVDLERQNVKLERKNEDFMNKINDQVRLVFLAKFFDFFIPVMLATKSEFHSTLFVFIRAKQTK